MDNKDQQLKLLSKEGKEFTLNKKHAELSILLKNVMQDMGEDEEAIPLMEVDEKSLDLVIKYLDKFAGENPTEIEKPLKSSVMKEVTDEWSASYIDGVELEQLVDLTVAANYMELQPLLDLTCAKLASMCKDKSEEEIFKTFGVTDTFSEEEKQKIRDENKWIEENL